VSERSEMAGMRLSELLAGVEFTDVTNRADPVITSLASDSRRVGPGALFAAVRGERTDGHLYIAEAVERGARAVVCERIPDPPPPCPAVRTADSRRALSALAHRFYGCPSRMLRVVGITGTDGKTSTTAITRAILSESGRPAGSVGTLGYCIGERWFDSDLTTPDPISLHESFDRMLRLGLTDVCMEVSSHSLVQHRVADVAFDVAVLTNITHDHLDAHGTRQNYARAKRMLFESLGEDAVAVLPAQCEFSDSFMRATIAPVLTYGLDCLADVRGRVLSLSLSGMDLLVRTPFECYRVSTSLTGRFNALNILAAATVAFAYGIGGEVVKEALRGFRGVPGRLERISVPDRADLPAVYVDYAHTPDALGKVLGTLRPLVRGRLVCVVGCGGDRDPTKRPLMGRAATDLADTTIFTADNSRSERTEDIIAQMVAGVRAPAADYTVEPDRRRAIELAVRLARAPDSVAVICGRGCEQFLKIGSERIPFDDRDVARQALEALPRARKKSA